MPRVLFFLQSAFSLWMLVDAIRRRADYYWFLVIMFPFGELVYFFMVKVHDPEFLWLRRIFDGAGRKKVSIDALRFQLERTPSFANKLALAQALYDGKLYVEAAGLFEQALATDGDAKEALYGLGLCRISLGEPGAAIEPLERLIELQPSYGDYAGWTNLVYAIWQTGRREDAVERLGALVGASPRLDHRILMAHYLVQLDRRDEARNQLRTGLAEREHAPKFIRRKTGALARQAKKMLAELEKEAG